MSHALDPLLLSLSETLAYIGGQVGERTLYRLIAKGKFPRPMKVGTRSCWRRRDLELWVEAGGSMTVYRELKRAD